MSETRVRRDQKLLGTFPVELKSVKKKNAEVSVLANFMKKSEN